MKDRPSGPAAEDPQPLRLYRHRLLIAARAGGSHPYHASRKAIGGLAGTRCAGWPWLPIRWICGRDQVRRAAAAPRWRYDAIILDPPVRTRARGKCGTSSPTCRIDAQPSLLADDALFLILTATPSAPRSCSSTSLGGMPEVPAGSNRGSWCSAKRRGGRAPSPRFAGGRRMAEGRGPPPPGPWLAITSLANPLVKRSGRWPSPRTARHPACSWRKA